MHTERIYIVALAFLLANHNNSYKEFSYQKTNFHIGESYRSIQKKFGNNLNYYYEGNSNLKEGIKYYDIKERSLQKGKVVLTPSIFFEFSRKDSLLQKIAFDFVSDNEVEEQRVNTILTFLSKKLPVLKEYSKTKKESYKVNGLEISVKADLQDMMIQVTIQ